MDSPTRPAPTDRARATPSTDARTNEAASAGFDPISPPPGEPLPDQRITVTRDALRDGSLLSAARRRVPPGTTLLSDAAIEADLDAKLAQHATGADVWLFGYGSLMWNPAIEFAERRPGAVHGWHRRFCLWLHMGRGSPDNPGLMLALDRGGRCAGLLFRIPAAEARAELLLAWRRELFTGAYHSRWVTAMTDDGPVRAATFVANRKHPRYAGRLDEAAVAARLATASGSLGSCATYLAETLDALQAMGLRDGSLERLQRSVGGTLR
ncbi:MAG: gamma-glutamylcyclotransferase [Acetobacteraceae bacterium]